MTRKEISNRLLAQKTCLECQISGKSCNENCRTQYDAGTIEETIETLEATIKILESQKSLEEELRKIKAEFEKEDMYYLLDQAVAIQIMDNHISELKGGAE